MLLKPMPFGELRVTQAALRHAPDTVLVGIGPSRRLHLDFVDFGLMLSQAPL